MARSPHVLRTLPALRRMLEPYAARGERVALVPTMGALHRGHLALVNEARRRARRIVVSIFVNPTQFAPREDFSSYPRDFTADLRMLAEAKVDLVWAPTLDVMYPAGFATTIVPQGVALAGLEDKFRPHFFQGVATVCTKLFTQVWPDFALFGEKDYQQLRVVSELARDLDLPLKIVSVRTVRDKDGLALSSRNGYLSAEERKVAPLIYRTLRTCAARIKGGAAFESVLEEGRGELTRAGFILDYLEARHALTLAPIQSRAEGPVRLLVAASLGKTRLIDNMGV